MKKILGVLTIVVLLVSVYFYFFPKQPKNIFDEIYQETEKTYRSNNVLRHIDGFKIRPDWPSDDPNILYTPFGLYNKEKTPSDYYEIEIGFNFEYTSQLSSVTFERQVGPNTRVRIWNKYTYQDRTLKKIVKIGLKKADTETYIEDEAQVKSYLEQYGITAKDLDSYYDEIVNQKVLKDWCSIYDSKYSPSNYGDVKIETQWENW
ncbi:TipC family immunity protein [Streptococcus pseudopneumoniae]|uniref:TipC family immunity protein n=4 Tax=Streptococcus TaxID=1301 RepID=UPI00066D6753|nr:TipC family immunity protein [Streptococcus pseudopneumoniae]